MVHLVGHLARRGVEMAHQHLGAQPDGKIELSVWSIALLGSTLISFLIVGSAVEYTIRILLGQLAMLEATETTIFQVVKNEKAEAQGLIALEFEGLSKVHKPYTGSIRNSVVHLSSIGGFWARWRGLGVFIMYSLINALITGALNMAFMRAIPMWGHTLSHMAAALITSRLHCAWTHKIMTMPSSKSLFERRVSCAQWKQLLVPTALSILARDVSIYTIITVVATSNHFARNLGNSSSIPQWLAIALTIIPGSVAAIVLSISVMLPAYAALVRKEASLLTYEDETIIPFDDTFGGKRINSNDVLSYGDAWQSFTGEARRRVVKLYIKFFGIAVTLGLIAAQILALEIFMIFGTDGFRLAAGAM